MAQRDIAGFKSTKDSRFADNSSGQIEEVDHRDMYEDTADSFLNITDHLLDEDDMSSNSATKVPSQQSVKAYVDANAGITNSAAANELMKSDGTNAVGSGLIIGGGGGTTYLGTNSVDTTDNQIVYLNSAGGTPNTTRGAYAVVYGNEASGNPGSAFLQAGGSGVVQTGTAGGSITQQSSGSVDILRLSVTGSVLSYASQSTGDDPTVRIYQNRVTTTDATPTTIHTVAIPASTTVFIEAQVVARRTGGIAGTAEDGGAIKRVCAVKNVAGTATVIDHDLIHSQLSQPAWNLTFVASGSNINVTVTGAADNNITWHLSELKVMSVSS